MKTVTEMAQEAGLVYLANGLFWMDAGEPGDELKRFAEIIRADAIADEREACAKVCDFLDAMSWSESGEYNSGYGDEIRNRSNT